MAMICPKCQCPSRIVTSRKVTDTTRESYHQCKNLNCSTSFVTLITVSHIINSTGERPDQELQPELYNKHATLRRPHTKKNDSQMSLC